MAQIINSMHKTLETECLEGLCVGSEIKNEQKKIKFCDETLAR